jgi:methyl-accepting chemotaxis protein
MKNLTIKVKLIIGFSILLFGVGILGIYASYSASKMHDKTVEITSNWMKATEILNNMQDDANTARRSELMRHSSTNKSRFAELDNKNAEERENVQSGIDAYKALINSFVDDKANKKEVEMQAINEIEEKWQAYVSASDSFLNAIRSENKAEAEKILTGASQKTFIQLTKKITETVAYNQEGSDRAVAEAEAVYVEIATTSIIILVIAFLLGSAVAYILIRDIKVSIAELARVSNAVAIGDLTVKVDMKNQDELGQLGTEYNLMIDNLKVLVNQIQNTAQQVAAASEELTASADESALVTEQVAKSITDVSEASNLQMVSVNGATKVIEQIATGVEQTSATIKNALKETKNTVSTAKSGNETICMTVNQMKSIEATVFKSATVVAKLGERSKEIGNIVDTISNIAGQTNLLALNAAIEAARAGEQGKGFAVVAEEVRKLAEQSQEAAKRIEMLIREIQTETESAVVAMQSGTEEVKKGTIVANQAGESFVDILQMVERVERQSVEIATTMEKLSKRTEDVVSSVQNIDCSTKSIASESQTVSAATEEQSAAMEEIAAGSRSLSNLAEDLQTAANKFRI